MFSPKKNPFESKLGAWVFAGVLIIETLLVFAFAMLHA